MIAADTALATRLGAAGLDWLVPAWPAPASVHALSTTRRGGVSQDPYATMNLGFAGAARATGDTPETLAANRARLREFVPAEPLWLDQVHGVAVANADARSSIAPAADAAVARTHRVACAVLAADCLPVLLCDRSGTVVATAHAGWRGLAAGIIENAVAAMFVDPGELLAWLGPAIGPQAFEVGADVHSAFCVPDPGAAQCFEPFGSARWRADLFALARRRLHATGVHAIYGGGCCTYSNPERFFSYRRERETGRMATLIWIDAD
jgi:YfiH family protein